MKFCTINNVLFLSTSKLIRNSLLAAIQDRHTISSVLESCGMLLESHDPPMLHKASRNIQHFFRRQKVLKNKKGGMESDRGGTEG